MFNRKFVTNTLLVVFLISRAADVSATVAFSEGLKYEGNPVAFWLGGTWWSVALMTLVYVGVFVHLWFKLRAHDYQSPLEGAGIFNKIISVKAWSAESQVRFDIFTAIFLTALGFAASFIWVVEFGLKIEWPSWKSSLAVGKISSTLMLILISSFVVSFFLSRMKQLTDCFHNHSI